MQRVRPGVATRARRRAAMSALKRQALLRAPVIDHDVALLMPRYSAMFAGFAALRC